MSFSTTRQVGDVSRTPIALFPERKKMQNWQRYRWERKDGADYVRITLAEPGGFGWEGPFANMREAIAWMVEREQQEQMIGVDGSLAERLTQLNEIDALIRNENSRRLRPL